MVNEKKRFYLLIAIMAVISLSTTGISSWILYKTALKQERERLTETARSQARLIEAIASFVSGLKKKLSQDTAQTTLSQIKAAHYKYEGLGKTGEFTLAMRKGADIVFLLRHRHYDLDKPKPVAFNSNLAEPMRLALSGQSGTTIGSDYRGALVLAAYEPVKDLNWGIVAKIDMTEMRAPFVRAAGIALGIMLLLVLSGAALFIKISNPIFHQLVAQNKNLQDANHAFSKEIKVRQQTERSLFKAKERLVFAQKIAKMGDFTWEIESKQVTWSDGLFDLLGYDKSENLDYTQINQTIIHPDDVALVSNWIEDCIASGQSQCPPIEYRVLRKDNRWLYVRATGIIVHKNGQSPVIFATLHDITEQKKSQQRISHLNGVLRSMRDVNQLILRERNPATLIRKTCRILVKNRGYASALMILSDEKDRPISWATAGITTSVASLKTMLAKGELPPCCNAFTKNQSMLIEERGGICAKCLLAEVSCDTYSLCAKLIYEKSAFGYLIVALDSDIGLDQEERHMFAEMAEDLAYALAVLQMEKAHDTSEQKRKALEKELLRAQKLESVGRLAGGVAHDYNNMLSVIIGYTEIALQKLPPTNPVYADLTEVLNAANRSADITRQLLAFARQQTIAPKVLDLNQTIENMLKMLQRLIGENIDIAWLPAGKLWPIKIDPIQVDQILANLCLNARDAIAGVGKVTIETGNTSFDTSYCQDHAGFIPGEYVLLAVSDDGSGMTTETMNKVFEPFYTTKKMGKGTGLGLATVYGIVKQNSGFINVYSEPDVGTTIKIYFTRHRGQASHRPRNDSVEIPLSRGETILLVEDDKAILTLAKRMLEGLNYTVLSANSPSEAINMADRCGHLEDKIHLLITDVVMPEMNGRELANRLLIRYPDLKVIFVSGYTSNVIAHRGVLDEGVYFLAKPFFKNDLALKVREVLDSSGTTPASGKNADHKVLTTEEDEVS
jgi:PAS domain S-box-containing protein